MMKAKVVLSDVLTGAMPEGNSCRVNIFGALDEELTKQDLSWDNCISFSSDNASVMLGKKMEWLHIF